MCGCQQKPNIMIYFESGYHHVTWWFTNLTDSYRRLHLRIPLLTIISLMFAAVRSTMILDLSQISAGIHGSLPNDHNKTQPQCGHSFGAWDYQEPGPNIPSQHPTSCGKAATVEELALPALSHNDGCLWCTQFTPWFSQSNGQFIAFDPSSGSRNWLWLVFSSLSLSASVDSEAARPRPKGLGRSTASGATGIMACAGCWWNTVLEGWSSMEGRKMEILWTLKHQSEIYCQGVLGNHGNRCAPHLVFQTTSSLENQQLTSGKSSSTLDQGNNRRNCKKKHIGCPSFRALNIINP